jgi:predicted RNA polymerase sigma factor
LRRVGVALQSYPLFHATRAELPRAVGQAEAARLSDRAALELTQNPAQIDLLQDRIELHQ